MISLPPPSSVSYVFSGATSSPQLSLKHRERHRVYAGRARNVSMLAAPVERRLALASVLGRVKWREACSRLARPARRQQQVKGEKYVVCRSRYTRTVVDRAEEAVPETSGCLVGPNSANLIRCPGVPSCMHKHLLPDRPDSVVEPGTG